MTRAELLLISTLAVTKAVAISAQGCVALQVLPLPVAETYSIISAYDGTAGRTTAAVTRIKRSLADKRNTQPKMPDPAAAPANFLEAIIISWLLLTIRSPAGQSTGTVAQTLDGLG